MGKYKRRRFKGGVPLHVYIKGRNSFAMFYTVEDFILFITMYSVYSRRHGIQTIAFCPMINHAHGLCYAESLHDLSTFQQVLENKFAWEHNLARGRSGSVFKPKFGSAPKYIGKHLKGAIAYVNNNPVEGRLKENAIDYKWNGLAYFNNSHPFSEKIVRKNASRRLRASLTLVDTLRKQEQWLGYAVQDTLFKGLDRREKMQLIDYIISSYNFIDYEGAVACYGSWENMIIAIDANAGAEHDLKEDWEDYSKYTDMIQVCNRHKVNLRCENFDDKSLVELARLFDMLERETDAERKQIMKFLHIRPYCEETDFMAGIPA